MVTITSYTDENYILWQCQEDQFGYSIPIMGLLKRIIICSNFKCINKVDLGSKPRNREIVLIAMVKLESIYPVNIIFTSGDANWGARVAARTWSPSRDTPKCPGASIITNHTRSAWIYSIAHATILVQTDYVIRDQRGKGSSSDVAWHFAKQKCHATTGGDFQLFLCRQKLQKCTYIT